MFGGYDNADFLQIILDESREKYFENFAKRRVKRVNDNEWKSIAKKSVLNRIHEEQIMIHY
jgi:hypothetical protein